MAAGLVSCREDGQVPHAQLHKELRKQIYEATGDEVSALEMPDDGDLEGIPQDPRNPLTPEKIALGKLLFHETGLAAAGKVATLAGTYSCASCHHAAAGFQANLVQGLGEGGSGFGLAGEARIRLSTLRDRDIDAQPVRTPSTLNIAYQELMFWNGQFGSGGANAETTSSWTLGTPKELNAFGYSGVETQAIAGFDMHGLSVDQELISQLGYTSAFDEAFADIPEDRRYSVEAAALAIAAYERSLLSNQAPFQRWLKGEYLALSEPELRGAIVFFGKGACANCHSGPSLAGDGFHALGMSDLHDNVEQVLLSSEQMSVHKGRGGFTMRSEDLYAFKTPGLYNLIDSRFYGHGASLRSVREVVEYKNAGRAQNQRVQDHQVDEAFRPLKLSAKERRDLVLFLEESLRDPNLARYVPKALPSGNCYPVADQLAKLELSCGSDVLQ